MTEIDNFETGGLESFQYFLPNEMSAILYKKFSFCFQETLFCFQDVP